MNLAKPINLAISLARNNNSKFRFGAVALSKRGRVLAVGQNSSKTHAFQAKAAMRSGRPFCQNLHAELDCLTKIRNEDVHTLIVVRILANGELALAKPCKICSAVISNIGVKYVVFSNEYGKFTTERRR